MSSPRAVRRLAAVAAAAAVLGPAGAALAVDLPPVGDHPLRLDVTETGIGNWHFDNRNNQTDDDHYGEWINRLDMKLSWWRLTAGFRLDSVAYYSAPTPGYLASQDLSSTALPAGTSRYSFYDTRFKQYQSSLLNRYQQTIYPSKLYVTYSTPDLEVTAGDFYVQFGRGLVLSLRKIDEVAVDTTLRGAKVEWHGRQGELRYGATLVGGYANPVRVDESSGRRLVAPSAWYFAGMPSPVTQSAFAGGAGSPDTNFGDRRTLEPNFRPDGIVGTKLEAGTKDLLIGAQASLVSRGGLDELVHRRDDVGNVAFDGPARSNKFVETGSLSFSLPNLPAQSAAYLEVAGQHLDQGQSPWGAPGQNPAPNIDGHAIYGSFSIGGDPVNLLLELRHTRRFWPLLSNTNATEFTILSYSAPPTTEPIITDTEFGYFGTCTTGGRARLDVHVSRDVTAYGSVGRYATWAERGGAECGGQGGGLAKADRNDVWDPFVGVQAGYDKHRSHVNAWTGIRFDDTPDPFPGASGSPTTVYYRESYARYDWFHVLSDKWAVQDQGFHRLRAEYLTDAQPWREGENYVAVQWASKAIASFGYEYYDRGGELKHYFNGSALWRFTNDTSVRLFVGQQRPALRCVSGICRLFPPFEGAKIELVARF